MSPPPHSPLSYCRSLKDVCPELIDLVAASDAAEDGEGGGERAAAATGTGEGEGGKREERKALERGGNWITERTETPGRGGSMPAMLYFTPLSHSCAQRPLSPGGEVVGPSSARSCMQSTRAPLRSQPASRTVGTIRWAVRPVGEAVRSGGRYQRWDPCRHPASPRKGYSPYSPLNIKICLFRLLPPPSPPSGCTACEPLQPL